MTMTPKNSNDAFAYLLDNKDPNNPQLARIATLSDLQVGLPEFPAELQVTGRFSQSVVRVNARSFETIDYPVNASVLSVSVLAPTDNSEITIRLPEDPRQGQTCIIKDELGVADKCQFRIKSPDNSEKYLNIKNGSFGFIWTGASWTTISSSGIEEALGNPQTLTDALVSQNAEIQEVKGAVQKLQNEIDSIGVSGGGGTGDVVGPASSTDNAVVRFNLTTGKLIQNSGVTIDDSNNVSIPGRITVTGGTTTNTDANLGNAAVGSFPYYDGTSPSSFALFGHKDLNHAYSAVSDAGSKNYALVQDNSGNTYVNASTNTYVSLRCNNVSMLALSDNWLGTGTPAIFATGDLLVPTRTDVFLGNYGGASATTVYAGTGDLNVGHNSADRTVNLGTGNNNSIQEVTVGSTNDRSFLLLRAGTGNMILTGAVLTDFTVGHTAGTGDITLGRSTASNTIRIGNANTTTGNTQTINIGAGTPAGTGKAVITIGNTSGASSTTIKAGSGGLLLTSSAGYTTITGSTATNAEAVIGTAEIGELPATKSAFPGAYAFFGHATLDHSSDGRYALVQSNVGDTFLGAAVNKTISFKNGTDFVGILDHDTVSFTGTSGTATTTTIGNTAGGSSTTIDAGTGDINIGTSNSTRTINIGSSGSAGATIKIAPGVGAAVSQIEVALSSSFYNKVRIADGGSSTGHEVYINTGNDGAIANPISTASPGGYAVTKIGTLNDESRVTVGSTTGASITTINAGSGGLLLSSSAGYTQITGSKLGASGYADAFIGNVEIGTSPLGASYAMFGHKDYDHSQSNYALLQDSPAGTKNTRLNAPTGGKIYFSNNNSDLGYLSDSEIYITGKSGTVQAVSIGSAFSSSSISINAGTGGVDIGTINSAKTINIGPNPISTCTTQQDVHIASKNTTSFNRAYICDGDSNTGHEVYILSNNGTQTTVASAGVIEIGTVNAATTIDIGSSTSGTKTTTIGNVAASSSTTIRAGSGGLLLSSSAGYTTITGSTSTTTEAIIGMAAVGELPATRVSFPNYFSMFGHKNLDQSTLWNYAVVQNGAPAGVAGRGDTFINSPSTIYFQFSGSSGGTVGILDNNTVSFTGLAGTATTTTIGNTTGASSTTILAGTGNVYITGSMYVTGSNRFKAGIYDWPTGSIFSFPVVLEASYSGTPRYWGIGPDEGNDLNFAYASNSNTLLSKGYLSDGTDVGAIDFTGQHRSSPHNGAVNDFVDKTGMIVVSTGKYKNLVSGSSEIFINEALPKVDLSSTRNQKSVFGVISYAENPSESLRDYVVGNWGSTYEKRPNDDRLVINSLGEGAIWICNINGSLENGDYITTCEIPGYGMKQDDDLLHNYTVAKITMDCNFALNNGIYQCEEFEHEGVTYRRAFVGCTYHCG